MQSQAKPSQDKKREEEEAEQKANKSASNTAKSRKGIRPLDPTNDSDSPVNWRDGGRLVTAVDWRGRTGTDRLGRAVIDSRAAKQAIPMYSDGGGVPKSRRETSGIRIKDLREGYTIPGFGFQGDATPLFVCEP